MKSNVRMQRAALLLTMLLSGGLTSAEGGTGHELGSSSWETITNLIFACTGRLIHPTVTACCLQISRSSMDPAAFAKLESAVCSKIFTQPCKCCDANQLVNQWHLKDHLGFCKKCLPQGI